MFTITINNNRLKVKRIFNRFKGKTSGYHKIQQRPLT